MLDNYQKLYPWKYGAIAASGDVFLMVCFHRLFLDCEARGEPIDLLQIARQAKGMRSRSGTLLSGSTGNIFFTLPGRDGFVLHALYIGEDTIDHEIVEPLSTQFSLPGKPVDDSACHVLSSRLRPSFFFPDADGFHRCHLDLLSTFFAGQSAADELVTSTFNLCMLEKQTGMSWFWQMPEATKQLLRIDLQDEGPVQIPSHRVQHAGSIAFPVEFA